MGTRRGHALGVSALLALVGASAGAQDQHHLYSLHGDTQLDQLGRAVLGLGDVDSDGRRDVMVGAPQLYTSDKGYVRAYSGRTGKALYDSLG
ncbi:MAG: integrin alpha, partial [Planctomycetota bacterium]|nr:integrin alpha [Planctomycetota bacterium]